MLVQAQKIIFGALGYSHAAGCKPMNIALMMNNKAVQIIGAVRANKGTGDEVMAICMVGAESASTNAG